MATLKQKQVAKKIVENGGMAISRAMEEVGYSPQTAKTPDKLTDSKGWKELMEKYLPDDKLFAKHEEALEARKWNDFTGEREEDQSIRLKAVELGYKLKKYLGSESVNIYGEKVIAILGGASIDVSSNDSNKENIES